MGYDIQSQFAPMAAKINNAVTAYNTGVTFDPPLAAEEVVNLAAGVCSTLTEAGLGFLASALDFADINTAADVDAFIAKVIRPALTRPFPTNH